MGQEIHGLTQFPLNIHTLKLHYYYVLQFHSTPSPQPISLGLQHYSTM